MDNPKILLKKLCCTCLSQDRKLSQLCRLKEGINNLYSLLSHDTEAYREGFFKDTASWFICWECWAIMRRISKFRSQVCVAQHQLTDIVEGRTDFKPLKACLSHLAVTQTKSHDLHLIEKEIENFIDCGLEIKTEADEDIPLSILRDNSNTDDAINSDEPLLPQIKEVTTLLPQMIEVEIEPFPRERLKKTTVKSNKKTTVRLKKKNKMNTPKVLNDGSKRRRSKPVSVVRSPCKYACPECDMSFEFKRQKYRHIYKEHREGFKCAICDKRFIYNDNLKRHELTHKVLPREECPVCHKMVRVDLVKRHARIHTERDSYECIECVKTFVSRESYEHHLKYTQAHSTGDLLKHKCPVCEKAYKSPGELRNHVNYNHVRKTQHKCPICGKALATPRCVTRHVKRAHDGVKENKKDKICQSCGKAFTLKRSLREHELIHTGERPLSCEICGDTFRQHASLYTHKKRVHKMKFDKKVVTLLETAPSSEDSKH